MIVLKDVTKSYGEINAVDHVSIEVADGEIFGIVGYSGAGKSTLIKLIDRIEEADSGEIIIGKDDICKLEGKDLLEKRRKISMIFQNFDLLWSKDVLDNIAFPLMLKRVEKKKRRELAKELAKEVGLEDKIHAYPSELSGGQKQRVAIARALIVKPEILLCDEATSALDPKTTEDILDLLRKINKEYGLTILMISHQMEAIQKVCDRLAIMADGRVIEEGTVYEIFADPKEELTKRLIRTVDTGLDVKKTALELKERYPEGHLLRLTFDEVTSQRPILFELSNKTHIPMNIVSANIKNTAVGTLGVMYVHIEKRHDIALVLSELYADGVKVEVI